MRRKLFLKKGVLGVCIAALTLAGCGTAKEADCTATAGDAYGGYRGTTELIKESEKPAVSKGELETETSGTPKDEGAADGGMAFDCTESVCADDAISESLIVAEPGTTDIAVEPKVGLLTSGEWCDNENWQFLTHLVETGRFSFDRFGIKPYARVVVHVVSQGNPAKQVKAELFSEQGEMIASAVTDYSGRAYLYYDISGKDAQADYVVLTLADGTQVREGLESATVKDRIEVKEKVFDVQAQGDHIKYLLLNTELTVELDSYTDPAKYLDVMFVFDTTGSMGDELRYLQKEFVDIAERISGQSTRFSVNFYRDFGDEYVIRSNEFMTDIAAVSQLIGAEEAEGGGDYEEAVDLALKNAVLEHSWDDRAVKLMFFILDAPPHDTGEVSENVKEALASAAQQGIRVIPIASSGVDEATEGFLRTAAMLTGGTYTFLTNDSGIGGEHLEPTIGDYEVEQLNDMIVRIVQKYMQ